MKRKTRALTTLAAFGLAAGLFAGTEGRLKGKVTDSAGNPLEGVTVTLTTPNLRLFQVSMKTDTKGEYETIVYDATMPYHLKFQKEGFVASEADKRIPVGEIGVVNAKLQPTARGGKDARPAVGVTAPSPSEQAAVIFNEGVDLLNAGARAAAETKFLEAVRANPELSQAWSALAVLAYEKKDWAKTLEYGRKAVDLDPSTKALNSILTSAAQQAGDKKAGAEWQTKLDSDAEKARLRYKVAVAALSAGDVATAEAELEEASRLAPTNALIHYNLAVVEVRRRKYLEAKAAVTTALQLGLTGGDKDEAENLLAQIIYETDKSKREAKAKAEDPSVSLNAGIDLINRKDYAGACGEFDRALKIKPDFPDPYFYRGMAFLQLKRTTEAKRDFLRYLELAPKGPDADSAREFLNWIK